MRFPRKSDLHTQNLDHIDGPGPALVFSAASGSGRLAICSGLGVENCAARPGLHATFFQSTPRKSSPLLAPRHHFTKTSLAIGRSARQWRLACRARVCREHAQARRRKRAGLYGGGTLRGSARLGCGWATRNVSRIQHLGTVDCLYRRVPTDGEGLRFRALESNARNRGAEFLRANRT